MSNKTNQETRRRGRPGKHPYSPKTLPQAVYRELRTLALTRIDWRMHEFQAHFAALGYLMGIDAIAKAVNRLRREAGVIGRGKGRPSLVEQEHSGRAALPVTISITCHSTDTAARALAALAESFGVDQGGAL